MSIKELQREYKTAIQTLSKMTVGSPAAILQEAEIENIKAKIKEINDSVAKEQSKADLLTVKDLVERYHIAYLADDHKFSITWNTSSDPVNTNFFTKTVLEERIVNTLNSLLPVTEKIQKIKADDVIKYCQYNNRSFLTMTSSFNKTKWDIGCYNQLLDLKNFWVKPDTGTEPANPLFNDLIYCLAGGKQENIDHLERWILYKYHSPEDTVNIPHINISGIPGENGKGLFKILLKTLFTSGSVVDATAKELINGFNAKWKDAVVLIYEEMGERELPENKIKSVTGNPELNVELKGKDAFVVDANYSILFFDNNVNGSIKLSGSGPSGEDRRYSVIDTNISLPKHIEVVYDCTSDEAKQMCSALAGVLRDRTEVSKWLRDLIAKHGEIYTVPKLHGQDYWARVNSQQTDIDSIIKDLATSIVDSADGIPVKLLLEEVKSKLGEDYKITSQKLTKLLTSELKRLGHQPRKDKVRSLQIKYGTKSEKSAHAPIITIAENTPSSIYIDANPFTGEEASDSESPLLKFMRK